MPIATKSSRINISKESKIKLIAEVLSKNLVSGDILLLSGELGVGKTTFVKYLINSFQINLKKSITEIPSPTFNIVNEYNFERLTIKHFDLYRIGDDVWRQAQGQNNEMQIAHGPWEDTSSNWADYSGGVQLPDGSWLYPTKDGKYIPETDEQGIERIEYEQHREKYDRNQPHPDLADSRNLRDHLKPFTQGTKEYDSQGGSLKGVPDDLRKQLLIQGLDKYRA